MSTIAQTSASSSFHHPTSIAVNATETHNNPMLGKIYLYFSLWVGERKESKPSPDNKLNSSLPDAQSLKFSCISYDADHISKKLTNSINDVRNVIENILCRGTDFQITSNINSNKNICDTLQPYHDIQLRASRSHANQTSSNKVKISSSSSDTIFYLTDKRSEDGRIEWIEFKVSFPVMSVKKDYEEMFDEENKNRDTSNIDTSTITDSISLVETTANIALSNSIMKGEFDQMLHSHLKSSGHGHVWTTTSPEGKEESLIVNPISNCSNFVEREGAYPNPLERSLFSTRQLIGVALLVGTGIFILFLWTISMSRKKEEKKRAKWDECKHGLLSSPKGLDHLLALDVKGACLSVEEQEKEQVKICDIDIKDSSSSSVTDETSEKSTNDSSGEKNEETKLQLSPRELEDKWFVGLTKHLQGFITGGCNGLHL